MTKQLQIGALQLKFLIDDKASDGKATMFEMMVPEQARVPAPHHHRDVDEIVYGLAGTLTMTVDGVAMRSRPGTACSCRAARCISFRISTRGSPRALDAHARLDRKAYFEELADVVNAAVRPTSPRSKTSCFVTASCRRSNRAALTHCG